jgi:hypothetical protein
VLIASAILEQFFSLSMVDAELDLDAMIVDRGEPFAFPQAQQSHRGVARRD